MKREFQIRVQIAKQPPLYWRVGEGSYWVGSGEGCEWHLEEGSVSARHARVWLEADRLLVEDAGSERGTLVNGYDISGQVEVAYPAWVTVGEVVLAVGVVGEALPEKPVEAPKEAHLFGMTFLGSAGVQFMGGQSAGGGATVEGVRHAATEVHYRLEKEIAQGGMGLIYQSEDPQLERVVAVKVSRASRGMDPRFAKEAKILAHLSHPNIVPIYSMGCDEQGYPFYSMKLVRGRTLQAILDGLREGDAELHQYYPFTRLLSIFIGVCNGVGFAHSKGVLHRDLKPDNVMVGEFGEVLVMDWGIAKFLSEEEPEVEGRAGGELGRARRPSVDFGTTLEGEVMGTPQFMSPEQARGRVYGLDTRSDLYALGAILYAILTLRPPMVAETLEGLLEKVRTGAVEPMGPYREFPRTAEGKVRETWPRALGIPEALQAVVRKAMALDPEERYATARELRMEIEAYQAGYATAAQQAGPLRQLYLLMRRHWVASLAAWVFFLGGGVFMVKLAASQREAERSAQQAREKAALAQISLAEVAERALDGEEMQRLLAEVPQDLRDQKWHYLAGKLHSEQRTIVASGGQPWLAFAADPKQPGVLLALQSDALRRVNLESGEVRDVWKAPQEMGFAELLTLSADGDRAAVVRSAGAWTRQSAPVVEVLDLKSGKRVFGVKMPWRVGFRLVFDPSGKRLLCESRDPAGARSWVQLWEVATEKLVWERELGGRVLGEFSRDGRALRVLMDGKDSEEWDARTGEVVGDLGKLPFPSGLSETTSAAQWLFASAPTGASVFTFQQSRAGRFLKRIEVGTGHVTFENRVDVIRGMGHLRESDTLVTLETPLETRSDRCSVLRFYHASSGLLLKAVPVVGRLKVGWRLGFHPGSGHVVVSNGEELRVWKFESASPLHTMYAAQGKFGFLGDSRHLVRLLPYLPQRPLELLDLGLREPGKVAVSVVPCPGHQPAWVSLDRKGEWVAVCGNPTQVFRVAGNRMERVMEGEVSVKGAHFQLSPSGAKLWTGGGIVEAATGKELCVMDREGVEIPTSAQGKSRWLDEERVAEIGLVRSASGGREEPFERSIVVWDTVGGGRVTTMEAPAAEGLEVSPDGMRVAEAGSDMRLRIRNAWTLELEQEFRAHDGALTAVAWHPRKPLLVTAADDLTVRIWRLPEAQLVQELRGFASQPEHYPQSLAISADGEALIIQTELGASLYRPKTFEEGAVESGGGRGAGAP